MELNRPPRYKMGCVQNSNYGGINLAAKLTSRENRMTLLQRIVAIISWCLAGLGGLLSLLICLATGMKSVPHMAWSEAVITFPLPLIAAGLASLVLLAGHRQKASRHYLFWALPPLCVSTLTLLLVLATFFFQPGK
jgi:hypothetical protein